MSDLDEVDRAALARMFPKWRDVPAVDERCQVVVSRRRPTPPRPRCHSNGVIAGVIS